MCMICNHNQGTPTNIAFSGMIYYDVPLCLMCVQLAAVAWRHPQLAAQMHRKLLTHCKILNS